MFGKTLNLNAEYYYTDFLKQVVVDMDTDPHAVLFYNLGGRSYSQVFQVEATYPFFPGFTLTAAYRWTDAKTTYDGQLREKPLTGKYKGLLTASYQTPLGLWQFDATLQLNGGGRMPTPYEQGDGAWSWEHRYNGFEQLSAQVTRLLPQLVCLCRRGKPYQLQAEESHYRRFRSVGKQFRCHHGVGADAWGKGVCRRTLQYSTDIAVNQRDMNSEN